MGKGGGALDTWIKEFCTLVFIQTIQAFTYAIIIIVVVKLNFLNVPEADTRVATMGMFVIIAFVSVFKIEEMLRKIFGIGQTKADHGNAMKSLAKTAIAFSMGKRVLNNAGKITKGMGTRIKSRKDLANLNKNFKEDNDNLLGKTGDKLSGDEKSEYERLGSFTSGGSGSGSVDSKGAQAKFLQKRTAIKRQYEKEKKAIESARKEGMKSIAKGFVETGGAVYGGLTGAIIGGADGNLDEALQGLVAGAGVGDAIGEQATDAMYAAAKNAKTTKKFIQNRLNKQPVQTWGRVKREFDNEMQRLNSIHIGNNVDDVD